MADDKYREQATSMLLGKSAVLTSGRIRAFSQVLMLVILAVAGCSGNKVATVPDRSTVHGLAEYVLWTFRNDSIEEFEKVNPPAKLIVQWVGTGDPDLPMVKVMAMGMNEDSLNDWKAIRKLAIDLGIDWQKTQIVDVSFCDIETEKRNGVDFQESGGAGILFETNGKQWSIGMDDLMRRDNGPWYFRDGLRWEAEEIRASVRPWAYPTSNPSDASMRKLQADAAKALNVKVNTTLDLGKGVTMQFALIPAGKFLMGARMEKSIDFLDDPPHEVIISKPFYMGLHEVTQAQWRVVMGSEPWKPLTPGPPTHGHAESNFLSVSPRLRERIIECVE